MEDHKADEETEGLLLQGKAEAAGTVQPGGDSELKGVSHQLV